MALKEVIVKHKFDALLIVHNAGTLGDLSYSIAQHPQNEDIWIKYA
jgi:hypothetical protein